DGNEQSGEARSDFLFGPVDAAVADAQEQSAHQGCITTMITGWIRHTLETEPGVEDAASQQEPGAAEEKGRDGFNREANAQIGRAPDEIDGRKRGDHQTARGRQMFLSVQAISFHRFERCRSVSEPAAGNKKPTAVQRWDSDNLTTLWCSGTPTAVPALNQAGHQSPNGSRRNALRRVRHPIQLNLRRHRATARI